MSNKTWQRRRDTATMPNWMVRFIYWIVDFLGEFGNPIRSAGNRIGKSIMFFVEITILLCLFFFSALHSFEMLEKFNITGISQWLAIVFFEVQFIHSSIALDIAKKRGQKAGNRKAIFIICLAFVEVSNVTALWGSLGGVLIGGVMPIMLLLSKGSLKDRSTQVEDGRTEERPADQVDEVTTGDIEENHTQFLHNDEPKPEEITEKNPTPEPIEPITLEDEKTEEIAAENVDENQTEIIEENPVADTEDIPEQNEPNEVENPEDIPVEEVPENPKKTSKDKPKRTKASKGKKKPKKSKKNITTDISTIIAVAQQLKSAGIFSRAELERQANTTTHYAKKAIAELEEMESKNPADIQAKLSVVAGGRN